MLPEIPFDEIAYAYDRDFTHSIIGKLQRERVRAYLKRSIVFDKPLKILEINCGTGEDAIWLSEMGHEVYATDLSPQMIAMAQSKAKLLQSQCHFSICGFTQLNTMFQDQEFDLIFSNFAGLNCVNEDGINALNNDMFKLLKPDGKLVIVLLGKCCWEERLYFTLKNDREKAIRRLKPAEANLG